jgi:hypothetical protein
VNSESPSSSTMTTTTTVVAGKIKQKSPPSSSAPVPVKVHSTSSNTSTSSSLSQNLSSRLNFKQTQSTVASVPSSAGNLIIKFNNDSLQSNPQAKVVSSTTDDNEQEELESSRLKNLKRRINTVYDNESISSDSENVTGSKIISLKPKRTASLNEDIKLVKPFKTGLVINSIVKDTKSLNNRTISSGADSLRIEINNQDEKKSVFNRIRATTADELPVRRKFTSDADNAVKINRVSTSFSKPTFQKNVNSKLVSTSLNKTIPSSANTKKVLSNPKMTPKLQMDFVAKSNTKNLQDRIRFA